MSLADEKYLLLTTFRRDGTPVATPVWAVPLDGGDIGFWTSSGSGKAKRLAHTARVTVQPCDARGRPTPDARVVEATARLVTGAELEAIAVQVRAKYGVMTTVSKVAGAVIGTLKRHRVPYGDRGVVISPQST